MFKRKVYDALTEWKEKYSGNYAAMLEGARRVGKSTVAEEFARNNFRSYIKVDFANVEQEVLEAFDDIFSICEDIFCKIRNEAEMRNLKESTINAYCNSVDYFLRIVNKDVSALTTDDVEAFLTEKRLNG